MKYNQYLISILVFIFSISEAVSQDILIIDPLQDNISVTNYDPLLEFYAWEEPIDVNGDSVIDFILRGWHTSGSMGNYIVQSYEIYPLNNNSIVVSDDDTMSAYPFILDDTIHDNLSWSSLTQEYYLKYVKYYFGTYTIYGYFNSDSTNYVGFRLVDNNNDSIKGWMEIKSWFYLVQHAYHSEANYISHHFKDKALINIYPNPADDFIRFEWETNYSNLHLQIYNIYGQLVLNKQITNQEQISIFDLSPGLYIYKLSEDYKVLGNGKFNIR